MAVRRLLIVHGRVHGVGFRASVAATAHTRGVTGWARNRPNGTVEVALEGDEEAVESVIRFCRDGPRAAAVAHVEVTSEDPEGLRTFEIR